ncbi:MAG: hypothetical protein V5A68_08375, partial [Candidatus Thermoplasmatota archaeon]
GMIGGGPTTAPNIQFTKDNTDVNNTYDGTLTVSKADNCSWDDITITSSAGNDGPSYSFDKENDYVTAGDKIYGNETITIKHDPSNSLIGEFTFN